MENNFGKIPTQDTKEMRREELYDRLERKKDSIKELIRLFAEEKYDGRKLVAQAENIYAQIKAGMPEAVAVRLAELDILDEKNKKLIQLENQLENRLTNGRSKATEEDDQSLDDIYTEMKQCGQERELLLKDDDTHFFYKMDRGIKRLGGKADTYEWCRAHPEKIKFPGKLKKIKKKEIKFSGLSVNVIVDPEQFTADNGVSIWGVHYSETIFNAIRYRSDSDEMDKTIQHEKIHGLYEVFNGQAIMDFQGLVDHVGRMIHLFKLKAPSVIINQDINFFQQRANRFFHTSQGELVSNFDRLCEGDLRTELAAYRDIIMNMEGLETKVEKAKDISDKDKEMLHDLIVQFRVDIIHNFKRFYTLMSDLLFAAEAENKTEDLQALMLLFSPGDYHKIEKYWEHAFGGDKYRMYQIIRRIIKDPYFEQLDMSPVEKKLIQIIFGEKHVNSSNPLNLRSARHSFARENLVLLDEIKSFDFQIPDSLRQSVAAAMKKENFAILGRELGYKTYAQQKDYLRYVQKLADALKLDIKIGM